MAKNPDISKVELRLRSVTKDRRFEWKDFSFIQLISYSVNQLFENGHEHLPWFGLINMNARLYDPAVGRFLSPDPYVQAPDNSQSFNRYSYAFNNPLKYIDPSGGQFIAAEMRHPQYEEGMSTEGWSRALEPPNFWGSSQYSYNWNTGCYTNNITGNTASWFEVSNWIKGTLVRNGIEYSGSKFGVTGSSGSYIWVTYAYTDKNDPERAYFTNCFYTTLGLGLNYSKEIGKMNALGTYAKWAGRISGGVGVGISFTQFRNATTLESQIEYGFDTFVNVLGIWIPPISLYWNTVGKPIHYQWANTVVPFQMQMNIIGLPATMPFK